METLNIENLFSLEALGAFGVIVLIIIVAVYVSAIDSGEKSDSDKKNNDNFPMSQEGSE